MKLFTFLFVVLGTMCFANNAHAMGIKVRMLNKKTMGTVTSNGDCGITNTATKAVRTVKNVTLEQCRAQAGAGEKADYVGNLNAGLVPVGALYGAKGKCTMTITLNGRNLLKIPEYVANDIDLYSCAYVYNYFQLSAEQHPENGQIADVVVNFSK